MRRLRIFVAVATLILLVYGGVEISEGIKFSHVQALTYEQFLAKRPQEGRFRITGGILDAANAVLVNGSRSPDNRHVMPLVSSTLPEKKCFVVVKVEDWNAPMVVYDTSATSFATQSRPIEGMLVTGIHSSESLRSQVARIGGLADDFVILEEGRKPDMLKGLGMFALGLLLTVAQIVYYRRLQTDF